MNRLPQPVLSLSFPVVDELRGQDQLYGLWSVFSKVKGSLQDGPRLENISWRLWYRHLHREVHSYDEEPLSPIHSHSDLSVCSTSDGDHYSSFQSVPTSTSSRHPCEDHSDSGQHRPCNDDEATNARPPLGRSKSSQRNTQRLDRRQGSPSQDVISFGRVLGEVFREGMDATGGRARTMARELERSQKSLVDAAASADSTTNTTLSKTQLSALSANPSPEGPSPEVIVTDPTPFSTQPSSPAIRQLTSPSDLPEEVHNITSSNSLALTSASEHLSSPSTSSTASATHVQGFDIPKESTKRMFFIQSPGDHDGSSVGGSSSYTGTEKSLEDEKVDPDDKRAAIPSVAKGKGREIESAPTIPSAVGGPIVSPKRSPTNFSRTQLTATSPLARSVLSTVVSPPVEPPPPPKIPHVTSSPVLSTPAAAAALPPYHHVPFTIAPPTKTQARRSSAGSKGSKSPRSPSAVFGRIPLTPLTSSAAAPIVQPTTTTAPAPHNLAGRFPQEKARAAQAIKAKQQLALKEQKARAARDSAAAAAVKHGSADSGEWEDENDDEEEEAADEEEDDDDDDDWASEEDSPPNATANTTNRIDLSDAARKGGLARQAALEVQRQRMMFRKVEVPRNSSSVSLADHNQDESGSGGLRADQRQKSGLLSDMFRGEREMKESGSQIGLSNYGHHSGTDLNLWAHSHPRPGSSQGSAPMGVSRSKSSAALPETSGFSVTRETLKGKNGEELESDTDDEDSKITMCTSEAQRRLASLTRQKSSNNVSRPQMHGLTSLTAIAPAPQPQVDRPLPPRPESMPSVHDSVISQPAPLQAQPLPLAMYGGHIPAPAAPQTPRTTRRQMLAAELPEDLRKQLLWERMSNKRMLGGAKSSRPPSSQGSHSNPNSGDESDSIKRSSTSEGLPDLTNRAGNASSASAGPSHWHNSRRGGVLSNTLKPMTSAHANLPTQSTLKANSGRPESALDDISRQGRGSTAPMKRRATHDGKLSDLADMDHGWDADYRTLGSGLGSRRPPTKKIRPPPKTAQSSKSDYWGKVAEAVKEIQNRNAASLSFEETYRYAYNLVLAKQGDVLYNGVKSLIKEHLLDQALQKIVPVFPRLQVSSSGTSRTDAMSSVEQGAEGEEFLKSLWEVWSDQVAILTKLKGLLKYMDLVYSPTAGVPLMYEAGLTLFRLTLLSPSSTYQIHDQLLTTLLHQIRLERDGETINRSVVSEAVIILLTLRDKDGAGQTVYESDFEPLYFSTSAQFYQNEGDFLVEELDSAAYLRKVDRRINEEISRTQHYLSTRTSPGILAIVDEKLIASHLPTIINKPGSGLIPMLDDERMKDLALLYRIYNRVPLGPKELKRSLKDNICARGRKINEAEEGSIQEREDAVSKDTTLAADGADQKGKGKAKAVAGSSGGAVAALNAALRWVQETLDLKDKFDRILKDAFGNDLGVESCINEAFEAFIAENKKAAEYISLFIDENLKKGLKGKTEEEVDIVLDKAMTLFRYLTDKDVFERYYKNHLAKRLVSARSVSDDAEKGMVAKLRLECGYQFTHKLDGMFNDMVTSTDTMAAYRTKVSNMRDDERPSTELSVLVLTAPFWPGVIPKSTAVLPQELAKVCTLFEKFYLSRHSGRRLTWQHHMGSADVKVRFNSRTHELNVSTFAMMVLLLFEELAEDEELSFKDISATTNIPDPELARTLQSLACGKYRILTKTPKSKDISQSDTFTFNSGFTANLGKIKIATVANKVETVEQRNETVERVEEERRHITEACIVRIMKNSKTMTHTNLMNEVAQQLASRFAPSPTMIKKRIEALIEREYLERGTGDMRSYNYLA